MSKEPLGHTIREAVKEVLGHDALYYGPHSSKLKDGTRVYRIIGSVECVTVTCWRFVGWSCAGRRWRRRINVSGARPMSIRGGLDAIARLI
jgi:hypothetical protein